MSSAVYPRAIIISGPSGVGKSSIIKAVLSTIPQARLSVSTTTRAPRPGEVNGQDYYFVSHQEFHELVRENSFVEWAEVYGQLYGTRRDHLQELLEANHIVLLDVDSQGARQIQDSSTGAVYIIIVPPSMEELRRRLVARRTESPESLARRLSGAHREMRRRHLYDRVVVNRELTEAIEETLAIVHHACEQPVPLEFKEPLSRDDMINGEQPPKDRYSESAPPSAPAMPSVPARPASSAAPSAEALAHAGADLQQRVQGALHEEVLDLVQERIQAVLSQRLESIVRDAWQRHRM